jgi:hypothetical protein
MYMKRFWQKPCVAACVIFAIVSNPSAMAAHPDYSEMTIQDLMAGLTGIKVSGQYFLTYEYGKKGETGFNQFAIQRGYISVFKAFNSNISARITPDISVDQEGDGIGDLEMRLKY